MNRAQFSSPAFSPKQSRPSKRQPTAISSLGTAPIEIKVFILLGACDRLGSSCDLCHLRHIQLGVNGIESVFSENTLHPRTRTCSQND